MPRDCWPSLRSSYQDATPASLIRSWALIYLPTICAVSVFVALTWLGLSMNNQTHQNKDLVVIITYFAALLVLECILLAHVALRRQKLSRLSQKPPYVESLPSVVPPATNNHSESLAPTASTVQTLGPLQSQPRPSDPRTSLTEVTPGQLPAPAPQSANITAPTNVLHRPSPPPSQKVPAICQPYHPSPTAESKRPATAAAYTPQPPSPPDTTDFRSSWDLTMANPHQSTVAEDPTHAPAPAELYHADFTPIEPLSSVPRKPPTFPPARPATPDAPRTRPLQLPSRVSAFPPNAPIPQRTHRMPRASPDGRARQQQPQQQPQPRSQFPGTKQVQSQSQSRTHSDLLEQNLISLAGTG